MGFVKFINSTFRVLFNFIFFPQMNTSSIKTRKKMLVLEEENIEVQPMKLTIADIKGQTHLSGILK